MITDKNLTFSEGQAITATAISENVLRLPESGVVPLSSGQMDRNLGPGNEIPMLIQVVEDFAALTSLTISVETSDNEDMSSATVLSTTPAIPVAQLVAGYRPALRIFPDGVLGDYVALRYTVTGSNATAGQITAALATEVDAG